MARNPAQIGNHQQLHTLFLANGFAQYPEFTGSSQILSANTAKCFEAPQGELKASVQWWQVAIHAAEVSRRRTEDEPPLEPLSQSQILNLAKAPVSAGPAPAGVFELAGIPLFAGRYSQLKARVTFTDQTAIQRVFDVDIGGGTTLSFCGSHVGVDILYPEPGLVIPPGAGPSQLPEFQIEAPGLVLDSWIQASAAPAPCAPIGRRAARYTTTRILTPGELMLYKIPPGAVEVEIFVDPVAGAATNSYSWLASGLLGALVSVGSIPPVYVSTVGDRSLVPGTARWLGILADPGGAPNTTSVVWSLEY